MPNPSVRHLLGAMLVLGLVAWFLATTAKPAGIYIQGPPDDPRLSSSGATIMPT